MQAHVDDEGCLCETCTHPEKEDCPVRNFVIFHQELIHQRARYWPPKEGELTVQLRISKCYHYME